MSNLPLASWKQFTYAGAFRLPQADMANTGRFYPCRGGISVSTQNPASMFVQGFMANGNMAWGEVHIPEISPYVTSRKELNVATSISGMLDVEGPVDTHGDKKDRALHCYEYNGKLIGSLVQQYDANRDNRFFMWVADDSGVHGLYELEGRYKASGWIGKTPDEWKEVFGSYYIGNTSVFSIVGRASSGPSFYGLELSQFDGDIVDPIRTTEYLCYDNSKRHGLHVTKYPELVEQYDRVGTDKHGEPVQGYTNVHYNFVQTSNPDTPGPENLYYDQLKDYPDLKPLGNDIWTIQSRVGVGFIIPGTRTYACIGSSAGHEHGLAYRIVNDHGYKSNGPAAYVQDDTSQFYWLYDLNDLVKVKNGELASHEVLPYEYGPFTAPVTDITWYKGQEGRNPVIGGSFDPTKNRVYISLRSADGNKPVVVAYDINIDTDKPELTLEERVSILEDKVAKLEGL